MRTRIDYTISGQTIVIAKAITIEDIRLIVDETAKVVICSSMQKDNVTLTTSGSTTTISVPTSVCTLGASDQLTVEIDDCSTIPSDYALQGSNTAATNTAILAAIPTEAALKNNYAARAEANSDGTDTYTIVFPYTAQVEESDNEITITV